MFNSILKGMGIGKDVQEDTVTDKKAYTVDEYIRRTTPNRQHAGVNVTPSTSLRQADIYSCIKIISESIAMLPLKVYKIEGDNRVQVPPTHRLHSIYSERPNEYTTTQELVETLVTNLLTYGNSYCYLNRRDDGKVVEIIPFQYPNSVQVDINTDGRVYYTYVTNDHKTYNRVFDLNEMLHIKLNGQNGYEGMSPIDKAAESIGISIANARYTAKTFENAAMTSGVLSVGNDQELTDEQYGRLQDSYEDYRGVNAAGKILILEGGATFQATSQSNQQAQVLELAKFSREQIGSIFRVPVSMLNDTSAATYNNVENNTLNFMRHTLLPHIRKIETAFNELIDRGYECKFDVTEFLRGDSKTQVEVCDGLAKLGAISVNEIRNKFGMNSIEGADVFQVATNNAEFGDWAEAAEMRQESRDMAKEAHELSMNPPEPEPTEVVPESGTKSIEVLETDKRLLSQDYIIDKVMRSNPNQLQMFIDKLISFGINDIPSDGSSHMVEDGLDSVYDVIDAIKLLDGDQLDEMVKITFEIEGRE